MSKLFKKQSFENYFREIGEFGLLSPEEEIELAKRIKQNDHKALEKLVTANLRFVVSVAKSYQNKGLSLEDLIRVLKEPKNAIIKQYQALFELDGVELEFSDDALECIAQMAEEKGVGARGLRGIIEKIMLPLQYELPSQDDVEKCIITKDYIEKKADVILEYVEVEKEVN